jgi:hypothetical protein
MSTPWRLAQMARSTPGAGSQGPVTSRRQTSPSGPKKFLGQSLGFRSRLSTSEPAKPSTAATSTPAAQSMWATS